MNLSMLQPLYNGFVTTFQFFIFTLILSIPLGLIIALLAQRFSKTLGLIVNGYVYLFRGTPLLLQMMFMFFGLPFIGIVLGRFEAALITLVLNYAAYFVEIFRGGLNAIPKGQYEALQVLSINRFNGLKNVILPQLWKIVMPSVGNEPTSQFNAICLCSNYLFIIYRCDNIGVEIYRKTYRSLKLKKY